MVRISGSIARTCRNCRPSSRPAAEQQLLPQCDSRSEANLASFACANTPCSRGRDVRRGPRGQIAVCACREPCDGDLPTYEVAPCATRPTSSEPENALGVNMRHLLQIVPGERLIL